MNKWIWLFATVIITFLFAYTLPVTIANPSIGNIFISLAMLVIGILGFRGYLLTKTELPIH